MAKQLIRKYIWLIDTIRSSPNGISYEDINHKWERSALNDDGAPMPKRTFHAHIEAILNEFDIEITCDRKDGYKYYIEDVVNEYGSIRSAVVDSLVLGNAVYEMPSMKDKVYINAAFSQKNLGIILKAISQRCLLEIRRIYDVSEAEKERTRIKTGIEFYRQDDIFQIEPYATVFHEHWFLVCRDSASCEICVFALARLSDINILDKHFDYPEDFNVKEYIDSFDTDNYYMDRINRQVVNIHDDIDSLALCLIGAKTGVI